MMATRRKEVFTASFLIFFISSPILVFCQKVLVADEVTTLSKIANVLGKTDWDFSEDPCSFENEVICDCNFTTNCHVSELRLFNQNLTGNLPRELVNLRYLTFISLAKNYLTGPIPSEWGSFPLLTVLYLPGNLLTGSIPKEIGHIATLQVLVLSNNYLSGEIPPECGLLPLKRFFLDGNRLTGSIPNEIGNISTLQSLWLRNNQLSGVLPQQLGDLTLLTYLLLSSNNFTGELPATLSNLTKLQYFLISDNNFMGKIPDLLGMMIGLDTLMIQAGGFTGPIPATIVSLTNLTDLRVTDLRGFEEQNFPPLSNLTKLKTLILRSCNIVGKLPDYADNLVALTTLDVSFNKLNGSIPTALSYLPNVNYMYLTGNLLTGDVPNWMEGSLKIIDLSYNNFTNGNPVVDCQERNLNLFRMESSLEGNNSGMPLCMRSLQCPTYDYSFHINCGGKSLNVNGTTYDADMDLGGASKFYKGGTNWAYSNTGHFMDDEPPFNPYIATTNSSLNMTNSELYTTARLSPISLTYYGFCLVNGNYTVSLHFAEIILTTILGTRVFDVYIQGALVLKNFNIEDAAGGLRRVSIRKFNASVTSNTLAIRFYWAGRGTTTIPSGGFYGPLISAISVDSHTKPPKNGNSIPVATLIGIVVTVAFFVFLVLVVLWLKGCLGGRDTAAADLKGLDLQTGMFTLSQIKAATNDFDAGNKIGEGGFGSVYKGCLSDGSFIAVKQLSSKSKQGNREFVNEIGIISGLQHPHLVKLYGCCVEGNQLLLVYEYMENNSLARALFGPEQSQLKLDWPTRLKICIGIARGLAYLHEESRLKIVHRDIKATNVLLDKNLNAKISDFGLAKLDEEEHTHISTRVAGTYGYMAPEYAMWGHLTEKADVYSFGIVTLEIVSGRSNISYKAKDDCFNLLNWASDLKEEGMLIELVDPRLESKYDKEEAMRMINIALQCANGVAAVRPSMSLVVSMLENRDVKPDFISDMSFPVSFSDINLTWDCNAEENTSQSITRSLTSEEPSTSSAVDLYPISQISKYT